MISPRGAPPYYLAVIIFSATLLAAIAVTVGATFGTLGGISVPDSLNKKLIAAALAGAYLWYLRTCSVDIKLARPRTARPVDRPVCPLSKFGRRRYPPDDALPGCDPLRTFFSGVATWAWYAGGWNDALAGHPRSFQFHHQPFVYFKNCGDGTPGRREHLKDGSEFLDAIKNGSLPQVSFYKPIGSLNQHPGYANILEGDDHLGEIVEAIRANPKIWDHAIIIVTFDENGGFWDHVPPPLVDRWGPGTRVPAVIISKFAKRGFIDHTVYDTTAILKLIEERFGLSPLGPRDRDAGDLMNALDLSR